jgi:hypothetical protein
MTKQIVEIGPDTTHSVYIYSPDGTKSGVEITTNEYGEFNVVIDVALDSRPCRATAQAVTWRTGWLEPDGDDEDTAARLYGNHDHGDSEERYTDRLAP